MRAGMVNCCFVPSWSCEEQQEAQSLLIEELDTRRDPERIPGWSVTLRITCESTQEKKNKTPCHHLQQQLGANSLCLHRCAQMH